MISIAIIGAGPSALFLLQRALIELEPCAITVFESGDTIGRGMPYSAKGANLEHVTNVSSDEIPELPVKLIDWLRSLPQTVLREYGIEAAQLSETQVIPRLLFGNYLHEEFEAIIKEARRSNFEVQFKMSTPVSAIAKQREKYIVSFKGESLSFDDVIICTGHLWPKSEEGKVAGYYSSPYPPKKLAMSFNHAVCIRGSSLTAVDAIATLAKNNGRFVREGQKVKYVLNDDSKDFCIHMYSKDGLLPALRIHMKDPYPGESALVDQKLIQKQVELNDGFLPLDFIWQEAVLKPLQEDDEEFYKTVKDFSIEQFVEKIMDARKSRNAFELLNEEYAESVDSLENKRCIPWKELLAGLSVTLSYPAKHFSAEDRLRLQNTLMPLIGIIVALMPPTSAEQLIALRDAGLLELFSVSDDAEVQAESDNVIVYKLGEGKERKYQTFVDCVGQPHLAISECPVSGVTEEGLGRQAMIRFRDAEAGQIEHQKDPKKVRLTEKGEYILVVPGFDITDHFQMVDVNGNGSDSLYLMAVPFITGLNPDYSGLDFCDIASRQIINHMNHGRKSKAEQVSNRDS